MVKKSKYSSGIRILPNMCNVLVFPQLSENKCIGSISNEFSGVSRNIHFVSRNDDRGIVEIYQSQVDVFSRIYFSCRNQRLRKLKRVWASIVNWRWTFQMVGNSSDFMGRDINRYKLVFGIFEFSTSVQ